MIRLTAISVAPRIGIITRIVFQTSPRLSMTCSLPQSHRERYSKPAKEAKRKTISSGIIWDQQDWLPYNYCGLDIEKISIMCRTRPNGGKRGGALSNVPEGHERKPSLMIFSSPVQIEEFDKPYGIRSSLPGLGWHRSIKSGLGFPQAFFKTCVMTNASPCDSNRPSIPQFSSHSRSLKRYGPVTFFFPDTGSRGL